MKTSFFCILVLLFRFASGQNNSWFLTGITDTVISITSKDDKIWVATQNAGIKVFDQTTGEITSYNKNNLQVGSNDFRIIRTFNNTIYAGAYYGGLYIFENNIWSWLDTSNSPLPGNQVNDIAYDSINAILWIATNKGLTKVQNDSWQIFDSTNSELGANDITCLLNDKNNTLWIGSRFSGVTKLTDGIFTNYNYDNSGLNSNLIRTIISDEEGILYIADFLGVEKYDPVSDVWLFVYNTVTSELTHNSVNRMAIDPDGNIWFATHDGITKTNPSGDWEQFYTSNSNLPHSTADGLFIDEAGNVWAGTFGGMAVLNVNGFNVPEYDNSIFLFPNPAQNFIAIKLKTGLQQATQITIYDSFGREIIRSIPYDSYFGEVDYNLNISALLKGVYFVKFQYENESIVKPFIKI